MDVAETSFIAMCTAVCIDLLCIPAITAIFIKRMHVEPIVSRRPFIDLATNLISNTIPITYWIYDIWGPQCNFHLNTIIVAFIGPSLVDVGLCRALCLLWSHRITRAKMRMQLAREMKRHLRCKPGILLETQTTVEMGTGDNVPSTWDVFYLEHQYLGTAKTVYTLASSLIVVHFTIMVIAVVRNDSTGDCGIDSIYLLLGSGVWEIVSVVATLVVTWKLRTATDAFHIKWSIIWNIRIFAVYIVLSAIIFLTPSLLYVQKHVVNLTNIGLYLMNVFIMLTTMVVPIYWSSQKRLCDVNFNDVMMNTEYRAAFKVFLASEFAVETMYFMENVQGFRAVFHTLLACTKAAADETALSSVDPTSRWSRISESSNQIDVSMDAIDDGRVIEMAYQIYDMFVSRNAPLEINISAGTRDKLVAIFDSEGAMIEQRSSIIQVRRNSAVQRDLIDANVFSQAYSEVLHLINDPFIRFINSPAGVQMLAEQ